jgi:hypothetical protein
MQKWRQWESAPDSEWKAAVEREAVIRPLAELTRLTETAVDQAVERLDLGRTSIYGLIRRYKQRPQTSPLLPFKRGRDKRAFFLDEKREDPDCSVHKRVLPNAPAAFPSRAIARDSTPFL